MPPPRFDVDAPRRRLRRSGLLHQVDVVDSPGADRWELGAQWVPDICVDGPKVASVECSVAETVKTASAMPDSAIGDAFFTWRAAACTPNDPFELTVGMARNALVRFEEADVEWVLWHGVPDPAAPATPLTGTPYLADANATILGASVAQVPKAALGLLMQALAGCGGEIIHAPLIAAPYLFNDGLVVARGDGHLETADGSFEVIFGHGYTGIGPAGGAPAAGTAWLYGSGPIRITRSEVVEFETVFFTGTNAPVADPNITNRQFRMAIAERVFLIARDPCCQPAVLMSLV